MERLMFPAARRWRTQAPHVGSIGIRGAASATAVAAPSSVDVTRNESRPLSRRSSTRTSGSGTSEDTAARLWSVLEESEIPNRANKSAKSLSTDAEPSKFADAKSVKDVDSRWSELRSQASSIGEKRKLLVERSLALARVAANSRDSKRALGGFHRLETVKPVDLHARRLALNATCEALLRMNESDGALSVLDLIDSLRSNNEVRLLNRRTYALAVASSLVIPSAHSKSKLEPSHSKRKTVMDEISIGAFKSSLRYFLSFFSSSASSPTSLHVVLPKESAEESKWTPFNVLSMLKEDFDTKNNTEARLSQELFEEVLVLSPSKATQIAEAMQSVGFEPSTTTFLAILHGAMKQADASKALLLLSDMHKNGITRSRVHYVATASALARKSMRESETREGPHPVEPWYFAALLDEYEQDFGLVRSSKLFPVKASSNSLNSAESAGVVAKETNQSPSDQTKEVASDTSRIKSPMKNETPGTQAVRSAGAEIDSEFASLLVLGMCAISKNDQSVVPPLEAMMARLKFHSASLTTQAFGALMSRLAQTRGDLNGKQILDWLEKLHYKRDKYINNGFLALYSEAMIRTSRAAWKFKSRGAQDQAKAKRDEMDSVVDLAERLVVEMVAKNKNPMPKTRAYLESRLGRSDLSNKVSLNAFRLESEDVPSQCKFTFSQATFNALARIYSHSGRGNTLKGLIAALRKDSVKFIELEPLYLELMQAYGHEQRVDLAVEAVAEMQSLGLAITPHVVKVLTCDVFLLNGQVSEGLAYALGLCRTYKVKPTDHTLQKMLVKALKSNTSRETKQEQVRMIVQFADEFQMSIALAGLVPNSLLLSP